MSNQESKNLERAIKEIAPDKATTLAAKYKAVMENISGGLTKSDAKIAGQSKDYLKKLATDVIDTAFVSDVNQDADKKFMVETLDKELDNVSSALGLKLNKIDEASLYRNFSKISEIFSQLRVNFPEQKYKTTYVETLQFGKNEIAMFTNIFGNLWETAESSNFYKSYLYANQDKLITAVGQFCNGNSIDAFKALEALQGEMNDMYDPEIFNKNTGLDLSDIQVNQVMSTLKDNKISGAQVFETISKIKSENKADFSKLNLSGENAPLFIVSIVLDYRNGKRKFVTNQIFIESLASQRIEKETSDIEKYSLKLAEKISDLRNYRTQHPDKIKDAYVVSVERNIAIAEANLKLSQLQQFKGQVKKYLAMSYAEKMPNSDDLQKVAKSIFSKANSGELRDVASKFGINLPPDFGNLEIMEIDYETLKVDRALKEEIAGMTPDARKMYEQFYNEFVAGGLDTDAKKDFVLHQVYKESQAIALLSSVNEEIMERDRLSVYQTIEKFESISKVPADQREAVRQKMAVYLGLLGQGYSLNGRLLSTYINTDLLDPKQTVGKDKTPLKDAISNLRNDSIEIGGSIEDVSNFLEVKGLKIPGESEVANSSLYAPILMKVVKPFNDKYTAVAENVFYASSNLGSSLGELNKYGENPEYFEDRAIPPTRLFKHALESFGGVETSINEARASVGLMLSNLEDFRANVQSGNVEILKAHPSLKGTLLSVVESSIQKAHFMLEDKESPISEQKITQLREAHKQLEEGYAEFLSESFKGILATCIIIAASVAAGIVSAGLLAGVGVESLILVSGGAALGSTLASRGAMELTNAVNLTKFSNEDMWSPENLAKDFALSWGLSLVAIGSARYLVKGLNRGASSTNLWMASSSKVVLDKLSFLQNASPAQWFGVAEGQLTNGFLKKFGINFVKQYGQTVEEGSLQSVHPILGFVAMVVNASHGIHLNLARAGVEISKVNAGVEGDTVVYKQAKPEEFIREMEGYFANRKVNNFQSEISPDGVVTLRVEDSSGNIATLEVKPARFGVEPDVAVKRVEGMKFNETTNTYKLDEAVHILPAMMELRASGFILEKTPTGFKAVKGKTEIEIKIDPKAQTELVSQIKELSRLQEELVREGRELEGNPSDVKTNSWMMKFASFATLLFESGCAKMGEIAAEGGNAAVDATAKTILDIGFNTLDWVVPVAILVKIAAPSGMHIPALGKGKDGLNIFSSLWGQAMQSFGGVKLRTRMENIRNRYVGRSGTMAGDQAVRDLGQEIHNAFDHDIVDMRRTLKLLELTDKFFSGVDRTALEAILTKVELSTNKIMNLIEGKAAWNQTEFNAEMKVVRDQLKALNDPKVLKGSVKSRMGIWVGGLVAWITYWVISKTVRSKMGIFSSGSSNSGGGDNGYGPAPEGAPTGAPSTSGDFGPAPTGAPTPALDSATTPDVDAGSTAPETTPSVPPSPVVAPDLSRVPSVEDPDL